MLNKVYTLVLVLLLAMPSLVFSQQGDEKVTLEAWMKEYKFYQRNVQGLASMNDGIHYTETVKRGKAVTKCSFETGNTVDTLFSVNWIDDSLIESVEEYVLSDDETKMLIGTNSESIFRHSYVADFYIFDIKSKKLTALSDQGKQQLATFSPDGSKVAFVRTNNLYYKDLQTNQEIQVTKDGQKNAIINGAPDWVYEEEFSFNQAFEWSPNSQEIAYIKFDESKVKEFGMTVFRGSFPAYEENTLYPEHEVWKYPKAGEDNSVVSVHSYQLAGSKTIHFDTGTNPDIYIPRIQWTKQAGQLSIIRLNRLQNKIEILYGSSSTGATSVILSEENPYYISESVLDYLTFLEDNKHFIWLSERSGYFHLYLFTNDGKLVNPITSGNWEVTSFIGYDAKRKTCYYQSAEESPLNRSVYSIKLDGKDKKKISVAKGWNNAMFSSNFNFYILTHSSATSPTLVTLHDSKHKLIRTLEDNSNLKKVLTNYAFNYPEFYRFKTSEGVELNGRMIKPANFDPTRKYPVLMTQYSGPNSQQVMDNWSFGWEQVMASKGYLVVTVDGRGTGARGEAFCKVTYLQLGKYETIDQIEAAKYLQTLPYVDGSRLGIWGWSYGGYISSLCMVKGEGIFKAGIAVAPVTNWRYYDNIYTERYMRTPQENAEGYDSNSPLNFADKLQGNFLLLHGTADDNVHFQNSAEFIDKLVQANKEFDMFLYPNRNHGIYGGNTRYHLYTLKTKFLEEKL